MRRTAAFLLALLLAAGCEKRRAIPQPVVEPDDPKLRDPGPAPVLIAYRRPGDGGPEAFRAAIVGGVLDLTGPCVRLQDSSGEMRTVVTITGATLKGDSRGWFLPSGKDRLRHGASVEGGGGTIPALPPADMIAGQVPAACLTGPAVELFDIRRSDPSAETPLAVPPPPPPPPAG